MRRTPLLLPLVALLIAVPGVSAAAKAPAAKTPPNPKPATAGEWAQVVAKAKREGTVAIYSSQAPAALADFAAKFKARYGITVVVNRQIDNITAAQVTAEHGTGRHTADLWVVASKPYVLGGIKNGWIADANGPELFNKRYDRGKYAKPGKAFAVGAAITSFGWNTQRWPRGLRDYPDFLNDDLGNQRIGVVRPAGPAQVDFWQFIEAKYGANFLNRLAALNPRVYPSAFQLQQSLAAGEVVAGTTLTSSALDLKAQGAPVDFRLTPRETWNAPWWGMILKKAPHPAAAQLLANYMVTPEGQAAVNRNLGAVVKAVPGTFFVPLRNQKLQTPQQTAAYIARWDSLFS